MKKYDKSINELIKKEYEDDEEGMLISCYVTIAFFIVFFAILIIVFKAGGFHGKI